MTRIPRSYLFVPGHKPDRFSKALASGAHHVVVDLEDAVASADKAAARKSVAGWLATQRDVFVRINAADTEWFEEDLRMLADYPGVGVMLPKADDRSLKTLVGMLPNRRTLALLEAEALLKAMIRHIERFEPAGEPEPWMTAIGHGPARLPVRIHAATTRP